MKKMFNLRMSQFLTNISLLSALFMTCSICYSQSDNLQENVILGFLITNEGAPLPGATIMVKGTKRGTTSDFEGKFSIKAKEGDVLVFSYNGFSTDEITVDEENALSVVLKVDSESSMYWCCTSHSNIPHCASNKNELEPTHDEDEKYIIKG